VSKPGRGFGIGGIALDLSPVVVQVPDFGERFWVYQIVDERTDSFVHLGSIYETKPGFYLLIGRDWHGEVPKGITQVFRSSSNTGIVGPRVFLDDTPEDLRVVQAPLAGVMIYPLAEYDEKMKTTDFRTSTHPARGSTVPIVIPSLSRRMARRRSMASGRSRFTTSTTSSLPM
jgi:hypothetical protein